MIDTQKGILNKQVEDLLNVQKVVLIQDKEIQALKGAVSKLIQERMQFVMKMRPPSHVATTKGESTKPISAANVEGECTKIAETQKTVVPPAQTTTAAEQEELSQKERKGIEALARSAVLPKPITPKAKAKGVVIQEGASKPKEVDT